jgi:hypothetical protein
MYRHLFPMMALAGDRVNAHATPRSELSHAERVTT